MTGYLAACRKEYHSRHFQIPVVYPEFIEGKYFAVTVIVSMIVGQMAGLIANVDWRMSLLAGYAGSDFLESRYKLSLSRFMK
jgi:hypothetical protein